VMISLGIFFANGGFSAAVTVEAYGAVVTMMVAKISERAVVLK